MKRLLAIIVTAMLILTACAQENTPEVEPQPEPNQPVFDEPLQSISEQTDATEPIITSSTDPAATTVDTTGGDNAPISSSETKPTSETKSTESTTVTTSAPATVVESAIRVGRNTLCSGGELYIDMEQRLNFIDFTSMKSALLCSKPNCSHKDPSVCSAFGMTNCPFIYDRNIYFFESGITNDGGKAEYYTNIIRADIDGTSRKTRQKLKGVFKMEGTEAIVVGDTIYFIAEKSGFTEFGIPEDFKENYLCSYNFKKNDYTEIAKICEGYSVGSYIRGVYNGGIYLFCTYLEEFFDMNAALMEATGGDMSNIGGVDIASIRPEFISRMYCYDVKSKKITECDNSIGVGIGYMTENNGNKQTLYCENGSVYDISDISQINDIINNKLIDIADNIIVDLNTEKRHKLLTDNFDGDFAQIIYSIGGEYIVRVNQRDEHGRNIGYRYEKVTEDKVVGAEMS